MKQGYMNLSLYEEWVIIGPQRVMGPYLGLRWNVVGRKPFQTPTLVCSLPMCDSAKRSGQHKEMRRTLPTMPCLELDVGGLEGTCGRLGHYKLSESVCYRQNVLRLIGTLVSFRTTLWLFHLLKALCRFYQLPVGFRSERGVVGRQLDRPFQPATFGPTLGLAAKA